MKRKIIEPLLAIAIVILFIFPSVSSTSMFSFSDREKNNIYHKNDQQKASWYIQPPYDELSLNDGRLPAVIFEKSVISTGEPMNSSWPMYCHDVRHTGRSPYSTSNNFGNEKWYFPMVQGASGSPVIDKDGTVYI